jgi:hypothetical protein
VLQNDLMPMDSNLSVIMSQRAVVFEMDSDGGRRERANKKYSI